MMERGEGLAQAKAVVVKVGSAVLADADGLNLAVLQDIVAQLASLRAEGRQVSLVSSGAVAAGRGALAGIKRSVQDLTDKQAAAAVGQGRLMRAYEDAFAAHNLICAQVLLTREDLRDRQRFLHARNTFSRLLSWGVIPIVNENDTVTVRELTFGDNDNLASLVLNLVEGDLFVNLTSAPGVLSANPLTAPDPAAIPILEAIEDIQTLDLDSLCGGKSSVGTGGMYSKLLAARRVAQLGAGTIILPGREPGIIGRALAGEKLGTWVSPGALSVTRRKYWLAYQSAPQGRVLIDAGAVEALCQRNKSLLPGGVCAVEGDFAQGDLVRICSAGGQAVGVGLSNYSADLLREIMGRSRLEVAARLGNAHYPEVVHRDNMLLQAAI